MLARDASSTRNLVESERLSVVFRNVALHLPQHRFAGLCSFVSVTDGRGEGAKDCRPKLFIDTVVQGVHTGYRCESLARDVEQTRHPSKEGKGPTEPGEIRAQAFA